MNLLRITASAIAAILFSCGAVGAQDDFYRGKRINLVIGYGTGGGYDTYARLLARFIGNHIPSKPNVIGQNMPGAGSRGAANWLYNVAPRDGTVIAMLSQSTPVDQALGEAGIQFDVRRLNWIGNMVVVNNIMFVWAQTGVRSIEDARQKSLAIGATGASSPSVIYPQVSNNLFGTKFRIVSGYPGGGDINLAVERGEVDGRGSDSWASLKANNPRWINERRINILFQIGPRREVDLPDIPLWRDHGQTDEQRQILDILSGDIAVGRPILTAPSVPADRVNALRKAFDDTMRDPQFRDAAAKANMYMNPMAGEELQRIVERIANPSHDVIEKVKDAIKARDVQERPSDRNR